MKNVLISKKFITAIFRIAREALEVHAWMLVQGSEAWFIRKIWRYKELQILSNSFKFFQIQKKQVPFSTSIENVEHMHISLFTGLNYLIYIYTLGDILVTARKHLYDHLCLCLQIRH